jgi:hypothetical protein
MTVELQSKERVSAKGKRRTETSFMLNRCVLSNPIHRARHKNDQLVDFSTPCRSHHSEGEVEVATDRQRSATPSTELLLPVQEIK